METETARYRSTEARHSSPVRWFINQFGPVREKAEAVLHASAVKSPAWLENAPAATRKVMAKKRAASWFEQSELWPTESKTEASDEPVIQMSETPVAPVEETVPFVEVKKLRKPAPRVVANEPRKMVTAQPVKVQLDSGSHAKRVTTIARFLNVNGAIEGMKHGGGIHFDFPGRGHFQALRLWKGSPEIPGYSAAQY